MLSTARNVEFSLYKEMNLEKKRRIDVVNVDVDITLDHVLCACLRRQFSLPESARFHFSSL